MMAGWCVWHCEKAATMALNSTSTGTEKTQYLSSKHSLTSVCAKGLLIIKMKKIGDLHFQSI